MLNLIINVLFCDIDWSVIVDIISIITSSLLSIVAIVISIKTLNQSSNAIIESSRANIVFYVDTQTGNQQFLTIKNFGNSTGKVLSININPPLYYSKHPKMPKKNNPVLINYAGVTLAPNQCVKSWFPFDGYPDKKFDVHIKYETLGITYEDTYTIDLSYIEAIDYLYQESGDVKDTKSALVTISNTLRRISER